MIPTEKTLDICFAWMQIVLWSIMTGLIAIWGIAHLVMGTLTIVAGIVVLGLLVMFVYLGKGLFDELDEAKKDKAEAEE